MSLNPFKKINFISILLLIFIAIFLGMSMNPVSAATINVSSGLQNYDIQTLIDGAQAGDTINFAGNSYSNVSLIINKKLNIISLINTVISSNDSTGINGSSMGITETFAFYFTRNSSGSVISGFNILTNSDYGIIAENVKNITISSNNISGGYKGSIKLNNVSNTTVSKNKLSNSKGNGLTIQSSKKISITGNQISNNTYSGIKVYKSNDINITKNKDLNNNLSGISIYSSKNISVKNNTIQKNGHGVYLSNTNKVNVSNNEINKNILNGISLEDKTENTYISYNTITGNLNGIYVDSYSVNDTLLSNIIANSTKNPHNYLGKYNDGNGIAIGDNYQESNSKINIKYNVIIDNGRFAIKSNPNLGHDLQVGANWYGTNNYDNTGICPMVGTCMLLAKLEKTSNGYALRFYDSSTGAAVTDLPVFNATFLLNNANPQIVSVIDGTAFYNYNLSKLENNLITAIVGKETLNLVLPPSSTPSTPTTPTNNTHKTNPNSNTSGIGSSNGNGTGSGNGSFSGSGVGLDSIGPIGTTSGGGSSGGGQNPVEVSVKNTINSIKDNPYTSLAVLALIALVAVGYFRRDKSN